MKYYPAGTVFTLDPTEQFLQRGIKITAVTLNPATRMITLQGLDSAQEFYDELAPLPYESFLRFTAVQRRNWFPFPPLLEALLTAARDPEGLPTLTDFYGDGPELTHRSSTTTTAHQVLPVGVTDLAERRRARHLTPGV